MYPRHSGHRPRKRYGQHFLTDAGVIDQIVAAIAPQPDQHLVEIGPGQGALTHAVLPLSGTLTAVEIDRDLIEPLRRSAAAHGDLNIYNRDILKFDLTELLQNQQRLRLIGNLPYNISTPLLFRLFAAIDIIEDMHFMLQKEVAHRISADPGSPGYGRLSVMVQYYCNAEKLFEIAPHSFRPPPRVDSALIRLRPHRPKPFVAHDEKIFATVVARAFSQRRKTLRNSLKGLVHPVHFQELELDENRRAETVPVAQFVALANLIGREIQD